MSDERIGFFYVVVLYGMECVCDCICFVEFIFGRIVYSYVRESIVGFFGVNM